MSGTSIRLYAVPVAVSLGVIFLGSRLLFWIKRLLQVRRLRILIAERRHQARMNKRHVQQQLQLTPKDVRDVIRAFDVAELIEALQSGRFTAVEVLHAYQEAALEADLRTNCICDFIIEAEETARMLDELSVDERRSRPLFGVPFSVKESNALKVAGHTVTRGYAQFLADTYTEDAPFLTALQENGAVLFVRTNIPQSLLSYSCSNPIYGTTCHPNNRNRTCGGSSGGEGALIGCGGLVERARMSSMNNASKFQAPRSALGAMSAAASASRLISVESLDSNQRKREFVKLCFCIVRCCSMEHVVHVQLGGMGSVPGRPLTCASLGPMSGDVATCELLMRILVDSSTMRHADPYVARAPRWMPISSDKRLRIGFYVDDGWFTAVPACERAVRVAVEALSSVGHTVVPFTPAAVSRAIGLFAASVTVDGGQYILQLVNNDIPEPTHREAYLMFNVPVWLRRMGVCLLPRRMRDMFGGMPDKSSELRAVYEKIENYRREFIKSWREHDLDVIVCPANASVAMPLNIPAKVLSAVSYTAIFNTLDFPAGVIPCTNVNQQDIDLCKSNYPESDRWYRLVKSANETDDVLGLPVGVQCVALPFQEEMACYAMLHIQKSLKNHF